MLGEFSLKAPNPDSHGSNARQTQAADEPETARLIFRNSWSGRRYPANSSSSIIGLLHESLVYLVSWCLSASIMTKLLKPDRAS